MNVNKAATRSGRRKPNDEISYAKALRRSQVQHVQGQGRRPLSLLEGVRGVVKVRLDRQGLDHTDAA